MRNTMISATQTMIAAGARFKTKEVSTCTKERARPAIGIDRKR